jgi:hypothetical protein
MYCQGEVPACVLMKWQTRSASNQGSETALAVLPDYMSDWHKKLLSGSIAVF